MPIPRSYLDFVKQNKAAALRRSCLPKIRRGGSGFHCNSTVYICSVCSVPRECNHCRISQHTLSQFYPVGCCSAQVQRKYSLQWFYCTSNVLPIYLFAVHILILLGFLKTESSLLKKSIARGYKYINRCHIIRGCLLQKFPNWQPATLFIFIFCKV